jgi:hypothetical protein
MKPIYFSIILVISLGIVTLFGLVGSRLSNIFKVMEDGNWIFPSKIGKALSPSKNDTWMYWLIIYGFTALILGVLYCYMEIQTIKNKPGLKGEKGEKGDAGPQGPVGRCDSC